MNIISADIGGTNLTLGLFEQTGNGIPKLIVKKNFPTNAYRNLTQCLKEFLQSTERNGIDAVSCGIAGPIDSHRAELTNLNFVIDVPEIQSITDCENVYLLNDMEAHCYGIGGLTSDQKLELKSGQPKTGNIAIIAAGTGLGEAILAWDGTDHIAVRSEGGHTDFASNDELEDELLKFLRRQYDHVSWERIVSGKYGIPNIYNFFKDVKKLPEPSELKVSLANAEQKSPLIINAAENHVEIAMRTMDLFVKLYGSEAGNLALKALAINGVYLSGGIAPRIFPMLKSGPFCSAFSSKGRFKGLLEQIPVTVITSTDNALIGAARFGFLKAKS